MTTSNLNQHSIYYFGLPIIRYFLRAPTINYEVTPAVAWGFDNQVRKPSTGVICRCQAAGHQAALLPWRRRALEDATVLWDPTFQLAHRRGAWLTSPGQQQQETQSETMLHHTLRSQLWRHNGDSSAISRNPINWRWSLIKRLRRWIYPKSKTTRTGKLDTSKPVAQIPQCVSSISHKSDALWGICLIHCGICEIGSIMPSSLMIMEILSAFLALCEQSNTDA